jgi:hypothetical protein
LLAIFAAEVRWCCDQGHKNVDEAEWRDDDYEEFTDGVVVGRIFLSPEAAPGCGQRPQRRHTPPQLTAIPASARPDVPSAADAVDLRPRYRFCVPPDSLLNVGGLLSVSLLPRW